MFVRDLDKSVLGLGGHGLEHYVKLRAATDIVVNSILRVRRLLKQKRTTDSGGKAPLLWQVLKCFALAADKGHCLWGDDLLQCSLL